MSSAPSISVIVPALNAADTIARTLEAVPQSNLVGERIVVDGGSVDATVAIAETAGARVITAPKGRGSQLVAGAAAAVGEWLLFLHADTELDPGWEAEASAFIEAAAYDERAAVFRYALDDASVAAARLEAIVAWRSRVWALPYGDQGLLISRHFYAALGGYSAIPLFEDVDLVRRIGRRRLTLLRSRAVTSSVRYRKLGYVLRPMQNLFCLSLYLLGISPRLIARLYG